MNKNWLILSLFIAILGLCAYEGIMKVFEGIIDSTKQEQNIDAQKTMRLQKEKMRALKQRQKDMMRSNRERMRDMKR